MSNNISGANNTSQTFAAETGHIQSHLTVDQKEALAQQTKASLNRPLKPGQCAISIGNARASMHVFTESVSKTVTDVVKGAVKDLVPINITKRHSGKLEASTTTVTNKFFKRNVSDLPKSSQEALQLVGKHRHSSFANAGEGAPQSEKTTEKPNQNVSADRKSKSSSWMKNSPTTSRKEAPAAPSVRESSISQNENKKLNEEIAKNRTSSRFVGNVGSHRHSSISPTQAHETPASAPANKTEDAATIQKTKSELSPEDKRKESLFRIGKEFIDTELSMHKQALSMREGLQKLQTFLRTEPQTSEIKSVSKFIESYLSKTSAFLDKTKDMRETLTTMQNAVTANKELKESDLKNLYNTISDDYRTQISDMGKELPSWLQQASYLDNAGVRLQEYELVANNPIIFIQRLPRQVLLAKELSKNLPDGDLKGMTETIRRSADGTAKMLNFFLALKPHKESIDIKKDFKPYIDFAKDKIGKNIETKEEDLSVQISEVNELIKENKLVLDKVKQGFGSSLFNRTERKEIEQIGQDLAKKHSELNNSLNKIINEKK
jgi:hypothetical protein